LSTTLSTTLPPVLGAQVLPSIPPEVRAKIDLNALEQRLTDARKLERYTNLLSEVAANPIRFFYDHAAFGDRERSRVWFVEEPACTVWFAGDVHGDLLAFESVCQVFKCEANTTDKLIFLGDLVDRGLDDRLVVLSLWEKMKQNPRRFGWIGGNHDVGLTFSEQSGHFSASISPAEFSEWLNDHRDDAAVVTLGRAFATMVTLIPCAIFLPELLAAHGGFPHSDRWPGLRERKDLEHPENLNDFVWNRLHESSRKIPNRSGRGSQFGAEDFHNFCNVMTNQLRWPVTGMVRGHDHVSQTPARWHRPGEVARSNYHGRILTINTLSHNQPGELHQYNAPNPRLPTLARWQKGLLPTPVVVDIPEEQVRAYANPCPACNTPRGDHDQCSNCKGIQPEVPILKVP
jgi:hypothetical protein